MKSKITRRQWLMAAGAMAAAPWAARAADDGELMSWFQLPEGGLAASRVIKPAPPSLVEHGKIRAGLFTQPPRDLNLMQADLFSGPQAAWRRKRLMEWFGYGLILQDWYLGMIIIDAKLLPISAVYAVNRRDRTTFSHNLILGRVEIAAGPWNNRTWARGPGFELEFVHRLDQGRHEINLNAQRPGKPPVRGKLLLKEDQAAWPSFNASLPTVPPHFFYTHKAYLPAAGELRIGDEKVVLDPQRDLANLDEHRNYAQTPARWTWGTAGGYLGGKLLAFNLGDTGGVDQENWNENCLWAGNHLELLGPVRWSHDPKNPRHPWTVQEIHGRADLTFTPDNGKIVSAPPLGKCYQMAGNYNGFVMGNDGAKLEIQNFYGCAEHGDIG